jgi:hypothetical protein
MYDLLMRLPFLGWVLICAAAQSAGLIQFINTEAAIDSPWTNRLSIAADAQ